MLKTHLQILDHKIQAHVSFKVKIKNIWIMQLQSVIDQNKPFLYKHK